MTQESKTELADKIYDALKRLKELRKRIEIDSKLMKMYKRRTMIQNNDKVAQLSTIENTMFKLMTAELKDVVNTGLKETLENRSDLTHIYFDGFLHGMTVIAGMIQSGNLSITTPEISE